LFALDPEIPKDQQRIFFETTTPDRDLSWRLDGKNVGSAEKTFLWDPEPGRHVLALVGKKEQILDPLAFEVRGRLVQSVVEREDE
jgi:penicillin-binding protein 1C